MTEEYEKKIKEKIKKGKALEVVFDKIKHNEEMIEVLNERLSTPILPRSIEIGIVGDSFFKLNISDKDSSERMINSIISNELKVLEKEDERLNVLLNNLMVDGGII